MNHLKEFLENLEFYKPYHRRGLRVKNSFGKNSFKVLNFYKSLWKGDTIQTYMLNPLIHKLWDHNIYICPFISIYIPSADYHSISYIGTNNDNKKYVVSRITNIFITNEFVIEPKLLPSDFVTLLFMSGEIDNFILDNKEEIVSFLKQNHMLYDSFERETAS